MKLIAYKTFDYKCQRLVPASRTREWMDQTPAAFAYHCLPLVMANSLGWFLLNDVPCEMEWDGTKDPKGLKVWPTEELTANEKHFLPSSHFGSGVVTFPAEFMFRNVLRIQYKTALCVAMLTLLMIGMVKVAGSDDQPSDNLSPEEIFKKTQDTYDSLTSYSDKGKIVTIGGTMTQPLSFSDIIFTTKLARPNLYQIEWGWERSSDLSQVIVRKQQTVWSAGDGDFLETGSRSEKLKDQQSALYFEGVYCGCATVTISGIFFKTKWNILHETVESNWKREADEKVGDIDCYVLSQNDINKKTLWIGKQDFLIHQIRSIMPLAGETNSTETHSDIVINQKFLPTDFTP